MSERAVIEAELQGADKVAKDAGKVDKSLKNTKDSAEKAGKEGKNAASSWKGFTKEVDETAKGLQATALLGGVIGGAVATAIGATIGYFSKAADAAEDFQGKTVGLSRRAGLDLRGLRDTIGDVELKTLQGADAQEEFLDQVVRLTYDGAAAERALLGMAAAATATGRAVSQMAPISAALHNMGVEDETAALGKLRDMAEKLGTTGGPRAFEDMIAALAPQLSQVASKSDEARTQLLAYLGVLTKGLKPEAARKVGADALGGIKSNQHLLRAITGIDVVDKNQEVIGENIPKVYDALKKRVQRTSKDPAVQQRILAQLVHSEELAAGILRSDSKDAAKTAQGAKAKAPNFVELPEDERKRREIMEEQRKRAAGGMVLESTDAAGAAKEDVISWVKDAIAESRSDFAERQPVEGDPFGAVGYRGATEGKMIGDLTAALKQATKDGMKEAIKEAKFNAPPPDPQAPKGNP